MYIPPSKRAAMKHLRLALRSAVRKMPKRALLSAYCSLAYLYPGSHPDGIEDWDGPKDLMRITREARRRADAELLTGNEQHLYQATKVAIERVLDEARMER